MPYHAHGIGRQARGTGGRAPFEVTADVLFRVRRAGKLGLNRGQTAKFVGVSDETLRVHSLQHPEIWETWEEGRMEGVAEVAQSLFRNATEPAMGKDGPTGPPGGHVGAQTAYLRHVGGWQAKDEQPASPINVAVRIVLPDNGRKVIDVVAEVQHLGSGEPTDD